MVSKRITSKVKGVQAARASCVESNTRPSKIEKPTQTVGKNRIAGTNGSVSPIKFRVSENHLFIISCKVTDVDGGFRASCFLQGDTS